MKVLLVSLNAKYIHTNLAIRYLEKFCMNMDGVHVKIKEFTINEHLDGILRRIHKERADVLCFSCYIWNIEYIIKIIQMLKRVNQDYKVILGGPEISFYGKDWMKRVPEIDYIVKGEGEITLKELLGSLMRGLKNPSSILGILYREADQIIENPNRGLIEDLDTIPFPYSGDLSQFKNKIIYYESSRGCPFHCQYCLSSTIDGVRFFTLDRVKKELRYFINAGVKQVKFVDRTFNCNRERSMELLAFLIEEGGNTNFHFEVAADLIDEEMLALFKRAPVGLFQLEIGIQSTKEGTLKAIRRKNNFNRIKRVVNSIKSFKNIHQHLDLIAGLPYEGYQDFKSSFNDVYRLKPDMLQLGFLKLLKGSGIEINKDKYGYQYTPFPPYEVLSNRYMSYDDIVKLKYIEELLEKYGNSHVFDHTVDYLITRYFVEPFNFYEDFSAFWVENGLFDRSHSQKNLYRILMGYISTLKDFSDTKGAIEILKFDYLLTHSSPLPTFFPTVMIPNKKEKAFEFLRREENIKKYLPKYVGSPPKEIYKYVHFERFHVNIFNKLEIGTYARNKKNITLLFDFKNHQDDLFGKNFFAEVELYD